MTRKVGFQSLQNDFNLSAQTGKIACFENHLPHVVKCLDPVCRTLGLDWNHHTLRAEFFPIKPQSSRQDKMSTFPQTTNTFTYV